MTWHQVSEYCTHPHSVDCVNSRGELASRRCLTCDEQLPAIDGDEMDTPRPCTRPPR